MRSRLLAGAAAASRSPSRRARSSQRATARRATPPSSTRCSSRSRTGDAGARTTSSARPTWSPRQAQAGGRARRRPASTVSLAHTLLTEKADDNASPFEHTMLRGNNMDRYAVSVSRLRAQPHRRALPHPLQGSDLQRLRARRRQHRQGLHEARHREPEERHRHARRAGRHPAAAETCRISSRARAIYVEDLEAWEKKAGVKIAPGDAMLLRTGRWARREKLGPWNVGQSAAGLHASVAPWIKARGVAFLGSDAARRRDAVDGRRRRAADPHADDHRRSASTCSTTRIWKRSARPRRG